LNAWWRWRAEESWHALEAIVSLGGPGWFRLGDRDLGLHLERTRRLANGERLSQVTQSFCRALGIQACVLPMSDEAIPTRVDTDEGLLPFQEYFVLRQCQPRVKGFVFENRASAHPAPGVLAALEAAHLIVICPSNPWVSIDPILAVPGVRERLTDKPVLAVSPIIAGQAVKGPAAKMFAELGVQPSALAVAQHYQPLLRGFVLDRQDEAQSAEIRRLGLEVLVTDTLMTSLADRERLAREVLDFVATW